MEQLNETMEFETIMVPAADGKEQEMAIMDQFTFEGKEYVALSRVFGDEIEEDIYLCGYHEEEDNLVLDSLDEAEFDKVCAYYSTREE